MGLPHIDHVTALAFIKAVEAVTLSLGAVMAHFRIEAAHHTSHDKAVLDAARALLTSLENAYTESVSLNQRLERRVYGVDDEKSL